jgi:hypothetical protein
MYYFYILHVSYMCQANPCRCIQAVRGPHGCNNVGHARNVWAGLNVSIPNAEHAMAENVLAHAGSSL